jgi:hypothetical protein
MSATAFVGLGATAREAMFADLVSGFDVCYAAMSWLAKQVGVSARQGFRLQASLREKGLLQSVRGNRDQPPIVAKYPGRLRHNGFAVRSVAGAGAVIVTAKLSRIADWRRRQNEEREQERGRKQADAERKRAERAARVASPNPPPAAPPFHREFPRAESAPTEPVTGVPAGAYAALYGRPPPE